MKIRFKLPTYVYTRDLKNGYHQIVRSRFSFLAIFGEFRLIGKRYD